MSGACSSDHQQIKAIDFLEKSLGRENVWFYRIDMNITFLGSGAWATALAYDLSQSDNHDILLYGRDPNEIDDINRRHQNTRYFQDITLPDCIKATLDPKLALHGRDVLVLAVPSSQINNIVALIEEHCDTNPLLVNVIKGFDPNTGEGISRVIYKSLEGRTKIQGLVSLVGPSFAYDVIHNDLTAVCAVSENREQAQVVQKLFASPFFRVYVQTDVVGAEIGAGMKNIIAIASGIMEGLGYKDNTRAALITRGLAEITRYGLRCGAKAETFLGLTGVGDLCLTASSHRSRNYEFGIKIGQDDDAKPALESNTKTVEGVLAAKTIHFQSKKIGIETPIVDIVYAILYEGLKPSSGVKMLMERELKEEN